MRFIILITSLVIAIDTIFYAIYEFKENKNHIAGITISLLSVFMVIFTNIMIYIR